MDLAKNSRLPNWGDHKSTTPRQSHRILVLSERYPEKKLSEHGRESTTQPTAGVKNQTQATLRERALTTAP